MARAGLFIVLLLAGCAQPIGKDGQPVPIGVALCETLPGVRCCRPPPAPPQLLPYCTRSLGVPDCWSDPAQLPNHPPELAASPPAPETCAGS